MNTFVGRNERREELCVSSACLERSDYKSLYISKKTNFIKRLAVSDIPAISKNARPYLTSN